MRELGTRPPPARLFFFLPGVIRLQLGLGKERKKEEGGERGSYLYRILYRRQGYFAARAKHFWPHAKNIWPHAKMAVVVT